jgi:hypothetical protein
MKIKPEHLEALKQALTPHDTSERRELYKAGKFYRAAFCKDINKRYRWDLLYASNLKIGDGIGMSGLPLYAYLTDEHIDTALRHLVPSLT